MVTQAFSPEIFLTPKEKKIKKLYYIHGNIAHIDHNSKSDFRCDMNDSTEMKHFYYRWSISWRSIWTESLRALHTVPWGVPWEQFPSRAGALSLEAFVSSRSVLSCSCSEYEVLHLPSIITPLWCLCRCFHSENIMASRVLELKCPSWLLPHMVLHFRGHTDSGQIGRNN